MTGFDGFDTSFDTWFDAGWEVFKGNRSDECYPPLNDMIAQYSWLCGFRAAWVAMNAEELLDRKASRSHTQEGSIEEEMDELSSRHLSRVMDGRSRLLMQMMACERDLGTRNDN